MDLERELNSEQLRAVQHEQGPLLILAGAGSGKTRVITFRIARLIQERGVDPHSILAVTFTNKAAGEMKERVERLVGDLRGLWMCTFHAFGARLLRRHAELLGYGDDFVIYDEDDSRRLGKECLKVLGLDPERQPVEKMLELVERAKRNIKGPGEGGTRFGPAEDFYRLYQKRLHQANAFDFSDLIYQVNRLWMHYPAVRDQYRARFEHVLVDEFQDTDRSQYQLLRAICPAEANLCVVGDDDQSIYMWRGANVSHILGFEQDYPGCQVIKLERNYRSSANILGAASAIIARNSRRHPKTLWTDRDPGLPVQLSRLEDERAEAEQVAGEILHSARQGRKLSQQAVFYRTNAQSRAIEEGFRLFGIPYVIVGGVRFFDRMEIRDLIAYLRLIQNPKSDVDLLRVLNKPARGIGDTTRERLLQAASDGSCPLFDVLEESRLPGLRKAEREKVLAFKTLLDRLRQEGAQLPAANAIDLTLNRTGYLESLQAEDTEEAQSRMENLRELVSAALDFARGMGDDSQTSFLEHVALLTDIDTAKAGAEAVTLMTLHAAKGLEFDEVFMIGMEDGFLPHRRSIVPDRDGELPPGGLEEERRLCYVGMTRAREKLHLSYVDNRSIFGRTEANPPSRFLVDLPKETLDEGLPRASTRSAQGPSHVTTEDVDLDDDDDMVVDYGDEFNQSEQREKNPQDPRSWIGRQVTHASFGPGVVRDATSFSKGVKLLVDFESVGIKSVLSNYVRPVS